MLQCGPRLTQSALVEVPIGRGVLYLCQLDLGAKLAVNPVAQHMLLNLIRTAQNYRLEYAGVTVLVEHVPLQNALNAIGLQYAPAADALAAIGDPDRQIALISAASTNLQTLAHHPDALQAFWQRGGTVVLCGLTPGGLADFNQIIGVEHAIRTFKRERVTFPSVRHPFTSGLTTGDIVLLSDKRIFGWTADEYVADDLFTHVVDLEDIAPFAQSNFGNYDNIVVLPPYGSSGSTQERPRPRREGDL